MKALILIFMAIYGLIGVGIGALCIMQKAAIPYIHIMHLWLGKIHFLRAFLFYMIFRCIGNYYCSDDEQKYAELKLVERCIDGIGIMMVSTYLLTKGW